MYKNGLILIIDEALTALDNISGTSTYFRADKAPIVSTRKVLLLLREDVINDPGKIHQRVLRVMHDVGMASYKDFEYTPVEKYLNSVIDIQYTV